MSGSTIGGIVGGVIGFWVGGPAGAQWGWMIGSAVGSVVDPDVIKGPRLTDPQQQTAAEGAPIPLIYGTYAVLGTIIQCQSVPTEHKHKESTGKGGPVQETFTYTRTVAVAICQAAPLGGEMMLRRAWVNGKLAYDATGSGALDADSAKFLAGMTFYSGSETQMPDPDLEALPEEDGGGVGNVPAYRGLCYAVLPDCDVTQSGGAVPIIKWEVVSAGTESIAPNGSGANWIATNADGSFVRSTGTVWTTYPRYTTTATGEQLRYANGILVATDNDDTQYSRDRGETWNPTTFVPSGVGPEAGATGAHGAVIGGEMWFPSPSPTGALLRGSGATFDVLDNTNSGASTGNALSIFGTTNYQIKGGNLGFADVSLDNFVTSDRILILTSSTGSINVGASNGTRSLICGSTGGFCYTDDGITFTPEDLLPAGVGVPTGAAVSGTTWVVVGTEGLAVSVDNLASFNLATLSDSVYFYDVQFGNGLFVAVGASSVGTGPAFIFTAPESSPLTWTSRAHNFDPTDEM